MWFFVSDLHGRTERYRRLFERAALERPTAILLGGDLLPPAFAPATGRREHGAVASRASEPAGEDDFIRDVLVAGFATLRDRLGAAYPKVFVILGNDDLRSEEEGILEGAASHLWEYVHQRHGTCDGVRVVGYACVPPTPFLLKDWERYDVSRYVDPGCVSPEEGWRSVAVPAHEVRHRTITEDLERLAGEGPADATVWLFHAPPHDSALDRAALDGVTIDHAPVDVHVGSIAIRRFIEARQPPVTLHGHIHESARLTGSWRQEFGRPWALSAAHDGPELALVRFDPGNPGQATRELI